MVECLCYSRWALDHLRAYSHEMMSLGPQMAYVMEVTQDGGLASPETPAMGLEGWGFEPQGFSPAPPPLGRRWDWRLSFTSWPVIQSTSLT